MRRKCVYCKQWIEEPTERNMIPLYQGYNRETGTAYAHIKCKETHGGYRKEADT